MENVRNVIEAALEGLKAINMRICKTFKHGISDELIAENNRQLDALRLAKEAVKRLIPMASKSGKCPECRRDLEKIYSVAEDKVYCCPYCGQALEIEIEEEYR